MTTHAVNDPKCPEAIKFGAIAIEAAALCLLAIISPAAAETTATTSAEKRQYTWSWQFSDDDAMRPRGGMTKGPPVTLVTEPTADWTYLREPDLSPIERDRRAILAMAGPYRTSFDFIEIAGFVPGYEAARPYQSWGTEYVYVVADEPERISLQHVIVMFFRGEDGSVNGPAVIKHWRQDWTYQDESLHVYLGDNTWEERELPPDEVKGTWSQAVYQVDDSPRYEATGRWEHLGNYSTWISNETWRPLPRREFSVRDDYDVLLGTNRHTITPTGWVHEELNQKVALAGPGNPRAELAVLAREAGLNRYERIIDHDFSAGDEYWSRTALFWDDVRAAWEDIKIRYKRFSIAATVDGERLFAAMFKYASGIDHAADYDPVAGRAFIDQTLSRFVSGSPRSEADAVDRLKGANNLPGA